MRYKVIIFFVLTNISLFAVTANDLLKGGEQRWDITYNNPDSNNLTYQKIIVQVPKVAIEVNKIMSFVPRVTRTGYCGDTGCNLDSVQCDAITENPICPRDTTYNSSTNRCEMGANSACGDGTWNGSECVKTTTGYGKCTAEKIIAGNKINMIFHYSGYPGSFDNGVYFEANCVEQKRFIVHLNPKMYYIIKVYPGEKKRFYVGWMCVDLINTSKKTTSNIIIKPSCPTDYTPDNSGKCYKNPTYPDPDGINYKCPIDPSLPCIGTEKYNHWCSPWKCNSENQCGYAYCATGSPSKTQPWMPRILLDNIANKLNGQCTGDKCDIVANKDISYCGKESCPQGFGVYEKDGKCYQNDCPRGNNIVLGDDGNCYEAICPKGTKDQGDGTCK